METSLEASCALKRATGVGSYWLVIFSKTYMKAVAECTLGMRDLLVFRSYSYFTFRQIEIVQKS